VESPHANPAMAQWIPAWSEPGVPRSGDVHAYLDEIREALQKWTAHLAGLQVEK
jgi:hypothetical protein